MPLVLRGGLGRQLTIAEGDGNFTYLDGRLTTAEAAIAAAHGGIDYFEVAGPFFYVHLLDATRLGPYALPSPDFNVRGDWAPSTSYLKNDIVGKRGRGYLVGINHTSDLTFDPALVISSTLVYQLLPGSVFSETVEITTDTLELTAEDAGCYLRFSNAAGCVVSVPSGVFAKNDEISFRQVLDAAPVSLVELSPAHINGVQGYLKVTSKRGATMTLKCIDDDGIYFDLIGGLLEVGSP